MKGEAGDGGPPPRRCVPGVTIRRLRPNWLMLLVIEAWCAVAQRHHGDHRAHADDDAERGQRRAHQVAADFAKRQHDRVPDHWSMILFARTACTGKILRRGQEVGEAA